VGCFSIEPAATVDFAAGKPPSIVAAAARRPSATERETIICSDSPIERFDVESSTSGRMDS
jgi:hypothetical protein